MKVEHINSNRVHENYKFFLLVCLFQHMGLPPGETRAGAKPHSDNLGCFGASSSSKNTGSGKGGSSGRKDSQATSNNHGPGSSSRPTRTGPVKGMELLWQPEVSLILNQRYIFSAFFT